MSCSISSPWTAKFSSKPRIQKDVVDVKPESTKVDMMSEWQSDTKRRSGGHCKTYFSSNSVMLCFIIRLSESKREWARTLQHAHVHSIVGSFRHTQHHLQAFLNLPLTLFTTSQQLLLTNTAHHYEHSSLTARITVLSFTLYLKQQLVLGDSLNRFDEVGGDGVGQPVSFLDLLKKKQKHTHTRTINGSSISCSWNWRYQVSVSPKTRGYVR